MNLCPQPTRNTSLHLGYLCCGAHFGYPGALTPSVLPATRKHQPSLPLFCFCISLPGASFPILKVYGLRWSTTGVGRSAREFALTQGFYSPGMWRPMGLIMKICAVVWKSASSLKCVNQFTPSNLEQVFYRVIEVGLSVASLPWQEGAGMFVGWALLVFLR